VPNRGGKLQKSEATRGGDRKKLWGASEERELKKSNPKEQPRPGQEQHLVCPTKEEGVKKGTHGKLKKVKD